MYVRCIMNDIGAYICYWNNDTQEFIFINENVQETTRQILRYYEKRNHWMANYLDILMSFEELMAKQDIERRITIVDPIYLGM